MKILAPLKLKLLAALTALLFPSLVSHPVFAQVSGSGAITDVFGVFVEIVEFAGVILVILGAVFIVWQFIHYVRVGAVGDLKDAYKTVKDLEIYEKQTDTMTNMTDKLLAALDKLNVTVGSLNETSVKLAMQQNPPK